jgi:hypothetical protein
MLSFFFNQRLMNIVMLSFLRNRRYQNELIVGAIRLIVVAVPYGTD